MTICSLSTFPPLFIIYMFIVHEILQAMLNFPNFASTMLSLLLYKFVSGADWDGSLFWLLPLEVAAPTLSTL